MAEYPLNNIAKYLEEAKLTQEQLASCIGASHQQVSRLENGERELDWKRADKIAAVFEVDPEDVAGDAYGWARRLLFMRSKLDRIKDIVAKPHPRAT
jgi:transcriptional regulator with XRE-family HTH domain